MDKSIRALYKKSVDLRSEIGTLIFMKLGGVLKAWRVSSDLTVRDAAKKLGVPATVYHRIECGQSCNADALATILIWLIGGQ